MDNFSKQLQEDFGDWGSVLTLKEYIDQMESTLPKHDFFKSNSRLIFSVCPDDINRLYERETIESALSEYDGEFHLGSLAAYPIGGVSAIIAASHHTPDNILDGKRHIGNIIFFVSPHVGMMMEPELMYGKIIRPGQSKATSSCGAMIGFLNTLKQCNKAEDLNVDGDVSIDPVKVILYKELKENYLEKLNSILNEKDEKAQVIALSILNYELVIDKLNEMIKKFLEVSKFEGKIVIIGGITVNSLKKDYFILKEFTFI